MNTSVKVWKSRIERGKALRNEQKGQWDRAIDLYNCKASAGEYDPERVDVHFPNWYIDNLVPLVYFRDPYIFIKSRNPSYSDFAWTMEQAVNIYWRKIDMKQQMKRVIKSGFLMPPGWIKTGYTAKIGQDIGNLEEEQNKSLVKQIKDFVLNKVRNKEELTTEEQGVLNQYIEEESIFATWIPSWNILLPEGYQIIGNMPYIIEIEEIPKIDFMANPLYENKNSIKTTKYKSLSDSSGRLHKPKWSNVPEGDDSEQEIVTLYHIQDRRERVNITLSQESDEVHFMGDWYPAKDGFDYEPLIFDESIPNSEKSNPYPVNVLIPILPQIMEQSKARTQMAKWRRRASALILAQRGLATEEDLRQFTETDAVQILNVSNIAAFQLSNIPNLPEGVFKFDDIIKQDLQMATNMGQLMFQPQEGQRTATQAQIGQSGLQLKVSARVDAVEEYTIKVAKKLACLLWNFYSAEQISELIGEPVTPQMWLPLPKDQKERRRVLNSEMTFRIDAGSTAPPKDESVERKQWLDAISIIATIAPERLRKDETVKSIIKTFKYVKDIDKIVISNDEEEMNTAMQENQLMLQGMPQAVSPNENHQIHVSVHSQAGGNPIVDQHILQHAKMMGVTSKSGVGSTPQGGDKRPPSQSSNPEIMRQGATNEGDIYQSTQNLGIGTGPEAK